MKVLMVLTSHAALGDTGKTTGFWLEEFAAPYYVFRDAGAEVVLASPAGGAPPLDPASDTDQAQTTATERFKKDADAQHALATTHKLADVTGERFDAIFYPGGHGPLWDLAEDRDSIALLERNQAAGTPLGLVCHAPGVLRHTRNAHGGPLVHGLKVTGFTNSEEQAVGLAEVVPFRVEDMLRDSGAEFSSGKDWASHVVVAGNLVTGQNPASSTATARLLMAQLQPK
ncbi:type 1 glutamine amidotransferase domain-containing protein [uncultured Salinisphaera sp.]|jgi:putative intracellular protease/amidase|uniref:type 1 glutamine amidotransferase domain-containing protein n=1 Tax=uncultured Salinisphaera sp. TaxID=359372 RepID=UPI0032B1ADAA|tara:strand:- start:183 stop:866 length:684 start_codon:yes stop_codon:yes gene_type:complete